MSDLPPPPPPGAPRPPDEFTQAPYQHHNYAWTQQYQPRRKAMPTWALALIIAGVVAAVVVAVVFGGDSKTGSSNRSLAAFGVCKQSAKEQLKAPSTAKFARFDDSSVTHSGDVYTVRSSVDSENGFGAMLRTAFTCTATYQGGGDWRVRSSFSE